MQNETVMTGTASVIEWYLAREGKQYGPLSDAEMLKLVELGHLRPDDLVWKAGLADWLPATAAFPPAPPRAAPPPPPPAPKPAPQPSAAPAQGAASAGMSAPGAAGHRESSAAPQGSRPQELRIEPRTAPAPMSSQTPQSAPRRGSAAAPRGPAREPARESAPAKGPDRDDRARGAPRPHRQKRRIGRILTLLVMLSLLGGAAFAAYKYRDKLQSLAVTASTTPTPAANAPPLRGFSDNVEAVDGKLQKSPLWQVLRREFPDWYQDRIKETARLVGEGRPEEAVTKSLADGIVALRRKNADHALAASLPRLKAIAQTFHANLLRLAEFNKIACFAFISQSEAHPIVVDLMQKPEHSAPIQAQLAMVFEAIGEGRRTPTKHLPPRRSDYDEVTRMLQKKGWKEADLELFSDSNELAKAPPATVCRLVTDWFDVHLAIPDAAMQTRLLVEAVRPVVGG